MLKLNRVSKIFADYAYIIIKELGDRISFVSTFNEPAVFTIHGLADGYMAPGISDFDHLVSVGVSLAF